MGGLVSADIFEGGGKVLFFRKTGKVYILEKVLEEIPSGDTLKGKEVLISTYHQDLLMERVETPPVKDPETLEVLIKKRLSEAVGVSEDLLILYKLIEVQRDRRVYSVLGIPRSVYDENPLINEVTQLRVSLFTSTHLSPAGVSRAVSGEMTIFHVYADGTRLIMTLSRGDEVLYTRAVSFTGPDTDSFLLEHVNMTYIFIAQRQNISVDLILLSGKAKDADRFITELMNTVQTGIATPLVPEDLRNVTPDIMHSFLIPVGNLYLSREYDFSPKEVKEKRWFFRTLTRVLLVIYPILVLLGVLLGIRVYEFYRDLRDYEEQKRVVLVRARAFFAEDIIREGKLDYFKTYVDLIYRSRSMNPLNILGDIAPLLRTVKAETYTFSSGKGKISLILTVRRTFPSLVEMTIFREKISRILEGLKRKGITYSIDREMKDTERGEIRMTIRLERKL